MMDIETKAMGYSSMSMEQLGELLRIAVLFLQANGLQIGLTIVTIDHDGMRTLGNLSPDTQRAAFTALLSKLDTPESEEWLDKNGKPYAPH